VSLNVTHGSLTLGSMEGLEFTAGDGTDDVSMTFTGNQTNLFYALHGLTFVPEADYTGTAILTLSTNDQGYSGDGGPLSDEDTLTITITPVNDPRSIRCRLNSR